MWGVYLCGCTDCFLHALFVEKEKAEEWGKQYGTNPEGYFLKFFSAPEDIPRTDTGWD